MERLRAELITLANFDLELLDIYEHMSTIMKRNSDWYFTSDLDLSYFHRPAYEFGDTSFSSQEIIDDDRKCLEEYLEDFKSVPDELIDYVNSIQ